MFLQYAILHHSFALEHKIQVLLLFLSSNTRTMEIVQLPNPSLLHLEMLQLHIPIPILHGHFVDLDNYAPIVLKLFGHLSQHLSIIDELGMRDMGQHSNLVTPKQCIRSHYNCQLHLVDDIFHPNNHSTHRLQDLLQTKL